MQSNPVSIAWMLALWQDITEDSQALLPACCLPIIQAGFENLPLFLRDFCELYYKQQMPLHEVARTLEMKDQLAKQRWVVSVSLFKMLLARKPKNPV